MAAADKGQPTEKLIRVHDEPGAVQFTYRRAAALSFSLGTGLAANGAAAADGLLAVVDERVQSVQPAVPPALEEELEDFISLDAPPAAAAAAVAAVQQRPSSAGAVGSLLDDYVSLGILDNPAAAGAAAAGAPKPAGSTRPQPLKRVPWMAALKGIRSPLLRLHQEIVEFCRYLAPSAEEQAQRQAAMDRIEAVVTSIWPKARLQAFGSFATGLYLPTSDVDAVVMGSGCADVPQGLKALANALARKNMAKNMQVIAKTKVPICKFEDAESGYNFDISFDVANGPEAAENVRALMDALPPMRPLVMVLKVFLQQRELNEVYSGGLGSYALLVMVATFLQLHPSRQPPASVHRYGSSKGQVVARELEGCLGVLLVDFLRLYGRALNNVEVGVSCRKGGSYFNKRAKGFFQPDRPFLYSVEDPNDPTNDLGRNSYNISRVRMAFDWAYCQIIAPAELGTSLLQRVIRLDPVLFLRAPPSPVDDSPPPPPGLSKKKKKHKRQGEEGDDEEEDQQRKRQKKRRRHRERSLSDEDGEVAGSGGRWHLEDVEESEEEERRPGHKKQRHHHHHHGHHHHAQQQQQQGSRWQRQQQNGGRWEEEKGGGSSRHVYFDD